ncbi:MAG: hypothetical protein AB7P07_11270 [Hyphomonadaceae bacterium]
MLDLAFALVFQAAAGGSSVNVIGVAPAQHEAQPSSVEERRARHALRCRTRTVTGSRMGSRVCMSAAEEEEQRRVTQEIADEMHRSGPFGDGGGIQQCSLSQGRNC